MDRFGRVVVFQNGARVEKLVPKSKLMLAKERVKEMQERGVRCHLVYRTDKATFPPPRTVQLMRDEGKLWCPHCRTWRFFSVPKFKLSAVEEVGSHDWFMNSMHRQGIKVCQWCHISEFDWYVQKANRTFGEHTQRRKRRKRRVTRRR